MTSQPLPPGQQLVAPGKWPVIGERLPLESRAPWSLEFAGLCRPSIFSYEQLLALPSCDRVIDIHCVTRWSKLGARFSGVLLSELLPRLQVSSEAKYVSFVARSARKHSTSLPLETALAQETLIAFYFDGQPLPSEHGGPIRNIVPGRYFYKSVKWLERIELLAEDRLGLWEAESGYHNEADPWREQRYMAPTIDRRTAVALIESKDFSGQDLRSIDAVDRELSGLRAAQARLRDANFSRAKLVRADFSHANLSNAHFQQADLRSACFFNADLEGADFSGADLRGADFTGCSLIGASFVKNVAGRSLGAVLDETTVLPASVCAPLLPDQSKFIAACSPR